MSTKKVPLRMCLGCRSMKPKNELVRVVKSSDGEISFDTNNKLPGRGAYICHDPECYKKVIKAKALSRALKSAIPEDVLAALEEKLNG